ncbi:DUF3570 domain-containing protein [Flavobacterium sp. RHBU_24]|uniref:DUF3570 domain-containing protein n=1 Tax=Flavobacterium sp. RHBU_24 TaxID=3391185 RepID=UPI0039853977
MKKMVITGMALMAMLQLRAQDTTTDSTGYKSQKLSIDEINLVSSYYKQDGNNSAVTGGIGTEKLTDVSNNIDVTLIKYGKSGKKHTYDVALGVDFYTSASSDMVDLAANSSASMSDIRIYPSLNYTVENEQKGNSFGVGVSSSTEFDYQSFGGNISYGKKTNDRNGEFTAKLQAYLDQVKIIKPVELRTGGESYPTSSRNSFSASLAYSQIINKDFQVIFLADVIQQQGYLSLPFHRVYFTDGSVHQELLPDNRLKIPIAARASYFFGDAVILRAYYRYYTDSWDIKAHTVDLETPVKLSPFVSVSPFYRYYTQTAAKYFNGYRAEAGDADYYTSNYDLSRFNSSFYGVGVKFTPVKGVLGIKHFHTLELRYGHYSRTTQLSSDIVSINIKYK